MSEHPFVKANRETMRMYYKCARGWAQSTRKAKETNQHPSTIEHCASRMRLLHATARAWLRSLKQ